jgi:hypothetical protein
MSTTRKLEAGAAVPAIAVRKVGGGEIAIGNSVGWRWWWSIVASTARFVGPI